MPSKSAIPPVIGYDPGFGNTKACLGNQVSVLQSAVSVPRDIGLAAIGLRSAGRKAKVVSVNGREYAVGQGAGAKGVLKTSMDYSSLAAPERRAPVAQPPLEQGDNGRAGLASAG